MPAKHSGKGKDSRRKRKMNHLGHEPVAKFASPVRAYGSQTAAPVMDTAAEHYATDNRPQTGNSSVLSGELRRIGIIGTVLVAVLILLSIIL